MHTARGFTEAHHARSGGSSEVGYMTGLAKKPTWSRSLVAWRVSRRNTASVASSTATPAVHTRSTTRTGPTATTAGLTSWTWTARRGTNTTRPMVRSTSEAPTTASGSTSRGKYTFETRSPSSMMALTPPPTAVANIIQTTMPAQTKDR